MFSLVSSFQILQVRSIQVDLDFYGKTIAVTLIVSALLMYPAGILSDRFHPLRTSIMATNALILIQPFWMLFLFFEFSPSISQWIFAAIMVISIPANALALGFVLDQMAIVFPTQDFCYRFLPIWSFIFLIGSLFLLLKLLSSWTKLGGVRSYSPPEVSSVA